MRGGKGNSRQNFLIKILISFFILFLSWTEFVYDNNNNKPLADIPSTNIEFGYNLIENNTFYRHFIT